VTLAVRRSGGTNGRVVVPYTVLDASARAGEDYVRADGAVALGATRERATFTVPLLDDARDEADESFTVVLGGPSAGAALGEPARAVVVIADDDPPAPPAATPVLAARPGQVTGVPVAPVTVMPAQPAAPGAPAATPARAALSVAPWQPLLRRGGVAAAVSCDRDCNVRVTGRIALGRGRSVGLVAAARTLRGHMPSVVVLRVRSRDVVRLRRALRRRGSLRAAIVATPSGGEPVKRAARVR
jgi:hypothetical protein